MGATITDQSVTSRWCRLQHPCLSVKLAFTEIHLRMSFHKLLHDVLLLLFVTGGFTHLLLSLVVHHLLYHPSRLSIQVTELAVLWLNFLGVDLGVGSYQLVPPFHLVHLL